MNLISNINFKCRLFLGILLFSLVSFSGYTQTKDSTMTAFKKGKWLTGLSGTISSNTSQERNSNTKQVLNSYGINIETGKFIKNRWLIGGKFNANRSSLGGSVDRTTETLYIGPYSNYYFTDSKTGSLFGSLSVGYVRYRDKTQLIQFNEVAQAFSEGSGLGSIIRLGYSYTINSSIAFDLGLNVNLFWVDISQEFLPIQNPIDTSISVSDMSFSFGFNIILDDFFF